MASARLAATVLTLASAWVTPVAAAPADPSANRDDGSAASGAAAAPNSPLRPAAPDRATIEVGRTKDENSRNKLAWHDSTFTFDQSLTTQTVGIGAGYQSTDRVYEWWLAFRPNYFVYEDDRQSFGIKAWANLYYELTNSDTTTSENEATIGPTFVWMPYARTLIDQRGFKTIASLGPRFTLPTDKAARLTGQYLGLGAIGSVFQDVPLRGRHATFLQGIRLGIETTYNHPMSRATTPVSGSLERARQDLGGRTFVSDQISPSTNVEHAVNVYLTSDVSVLHTLNWNVTYVLLNSWLYDVSHAQVCTPTGCVAPRAIDDPSTFRPSTWVITSLDYDIVDELTLSLGYYNRSTQLGPNGERRNVFWSPEARFFLSAIAKLDTLYGHLKPKQARQMSQR